MKIPQEYLTRTGDDYAQAAAERDPEFRRLSDKAATDRQRGEEFERCLSDAITAHARDQGALRTAFAPPADTPDDTGPADPTPAQSFGAAVQASLPMHPALGRLLAVHPDDGPDAA
ncbi:MAG: hypothetical protein ABR571_10135 [Jatrophihabitans sp.]|uniref:hypothetical protein n=1 Tax=Jatrophihabitans sp. TaxID=1932789 RepID=UPI0039158640